MIPVNELPITPIRRQLKQGEVGSTPLDHLSHDTEQGAGNTDTNKYVDERTQATLV